MQLRHRSASGCSEAGRVASRVRGPRWPLRLIRLLLWLVVCGAAPLLNAPLSAEVLSGSAALGGQPEFLRAEEAFVLSTRMDGGTLIASWRIADGYYLYRSRTTLTAEAGSDVRVGAAQFPSGKHKTDEYFGDMEVYYHELRVRLPLLAGSAGKRLKITYQGCADAGLCYPPQTKWFVLPAKLPAAVAGSGRSSGSRVEALPAASTSGAAAAAAHDTAVTSAVMRSDAPVATSSAASGFTSGVAPGVTPSIASPSVLPAFNAAVSAGDVAGANASEEQHLATLLAGGSVFTALALFFLAGIGLAFTPCVLPMVPILSSIIVGDELRARAGPAGLSGSAALSGPVAANGQIATGVADSRLSTRGRALALSLAYVLGMALTYAALGTVVGLFGGTLNLQAHFQSPPVLIGSALVFVLLALSMFGLYELQLPSWLLQRLNALSSRQQGGRLLSVAVMGALSALIVSPCVSAPLVGALIYLSGTGDALLGGSALLALGLGMGLPLLVVGVGGASVLPRAGAWMEQVKAVFGVLLLGVAVWLVERIVPGPVTLALWAALCIGAGVYLGALDLHAMRDDGIRRSGVARLAQAVGVTVLVWGVLLAVGAASGASDPLAPLGKLASERGPAGAVPASQPQFVEVRGLKQVEAAIAAAQRSGRPVMLDLYADWCIACKVMERQVFPDGAVAAAMSQFTLLRADVTANSDEDRELLARFKLFGPPSMLLFDGAGREREEFRIQGEKSASELSAHLRRFLASS